MITPAHVQDATVVNLTALTTSMAPSLTGVGAGNCLSLCIASTTITSGYVATGVTDSGTATWLRGPVEQSSAGTVEIWYGLNASSGTHTLTVSTNSGTNGCQLSEFSGVAAVQPAIDTSGVNTATSATITAPSIHPANVGELLVFATVSANAQTASPSSPYTTLVGPTLATIQLAGIAYVANNGLVSSYAPTWTQVSGVYAAVGLALKGGQPTGNAIYNDPAAQNNAGVLSAQARPDYLDAVIDALAATGTGVLSGCACSPNLGTDLKVQVAAGTALLNWGPITVSATTAIAVTAADSTNPRRDLIYVDQTGTVDYAAGTANATPCPPTLPPNCIAIAVIDVPANATQVDNTTSTAQAHVIDKRSTLGLGQSGFQNFQVRSGALFETTPRQGAIVGAGAVLQSGKLVLTAIWLPAGLVIGHIGWISSTTAASTPTHWWYGLYDSNLNQLAVTADQTTTVWGSSTEKKLAVATNAQGTATSFTTTYGGLHYVGIMVAASSVPSLIAAGGSANSSAAIALAPVLWGGSTGSLTTPPAFPFTAAALGSPQGFQCPYAYVAA